MHFVEGGGYERREWWSDEGWAWKEEYDITHPEGWTADGPREDDAPACPARLLVRGRCLGSLARCTVALRGGVGKGSDPGSGPAAGHRARLGVDVHPAFTGYPGFAAHPYREYSEVFFGDAYRVLRGGSWATSERVRSTTFRNWDLPLRRQIFAGVRLAKDVT